jgi:hypothetical protein
MKLSRLACATAPLLMLGLAACGSGGPAGAPGTTAAATPAAATPAAQFAAAADRVCARQNQQESALGPGLVNADLVPAAHLAKAAAYLSQIVSIRSSGLPALQQLAARGPTSGRAAREAVVQANAKVVADYRAAAQAARDGNLAAFRADFGRVAPHGTPDGPDAKAFAQAAAAFPFRVCSKGPGL